MLRLTDPYLLVNNMNTTTFLCLAATIASVMMAGGCSHSTPSSTASAPIAVSAPRLSDAEVEKKVDAVQSNTSIPDSAKPGIIAGIRAQNASR